MEMMRFHVPLCSWNSPAPLTGNTGLYLSRSVSAKQSGWLQIFGVMQERMYIVCDTSRCDQWLEAASYDTWASKHITKRRRQAVVLVNEESVACKHKGKMTSLWTSPNWNRFFSEPTHCTTRASNSLPRKIRCFASSPSLLLKSK